MQNNLPEDSPLGANSEYPSAYAPELLFPIARSLGRVELGIDENELPFFGADLWTAFEISWLNLKGKPQVAVAEITVPCDSSNLIESKSLKLYLNSLNRANFESLQQVKEIIESDLSNCADATVSLKMSAQNEPVAEVADEQGFYCIDDLDVEISEYKPNAQLLNVTTEQTSLEKLSSHLLKSNCPVTGQPDWASVFIEYSGPRIEHAGLLQYIVSFREHQGFHEQCVEQIFVDLMRQCSPTSLTVSARYLRRGGLDINPTRSTETDFPAVGRQLRQ